MENTSSLFAPKLIRASAGSGKTFELSSRFIALLAAGERAERILATTFTRKAAGEIQERVFLRLAQAALDQKEAKELGRAIEQPDFSSSRAKEILAELIRCQHRLNVCTLDSFFFRIVVSFGLELGLVPGWSIADEATNDALRLEAVRAVCRERDSAELADLIRLLSKGDHRRSVHHRIDREVARLHEFYRETDASAWQWLEPPQRIKKERIASLKEQLATLELPKTQKGKDSAGWAKAISKVLSVIEEGDWQAFVEVGLVKKIIDGEKSYYNREIPSEYKSVFQGLIAQAKAVILDRLQRQTLGTYRLLQLFDAEFEKQRMLSRTLGFSDLKYKLIDAALMGELDEVYYRLDSRIFHLLLDEFQDTSRAEWQVLRPMVDEILSKAGEEYSFFCVGDVKQAIYGWRGGVAEIFDTLEEQWPQLDCQSREQSFRCSQPVIDTVNQVFEQIASNAALAKHAEATKKWGARCKHHTTAFPEQPGYAQLIAAEPEDENQSSEDAVYRRTALLVRDIVKKSPSAEVGILVRKNITVSRLIFELGRSDIEISASEEGGSPLTDSPAVSLVLSLLTLTDHPGDSIARFHVATSPLGQCVGLTDYRDTHTAIRVGHDVRQRLMAGGYGATIYSWAQGIADTCSDRDFHRLMQLVQLGHTYDAKQTIRTRDFVQFVNTQRVEDPSSANVRVMTVHQSKGLQFDVVVLPELDSKHLSSLRDQLMVFRTDPIEAPERVFRITSEAVRRLDDGLEELFQQTSDERLKEALSVLYVAMTRAKYALHMVVQPPHDLSKPPLTYAGILCSALADTEAEASPILFETGDRQWTKQVKELREDKSKGQAEERTARQQKIKLAKSALRRRGLIRQTPSGFEGGAKVDLSLTMRLENAEAISRGILIHQFFEQIEWLDHGIPSADELKEVVLAAKQRAKDLNALIDEFHKMLKHGAIRRALSKEAYEDWQAEELEVFQEQPFAYREQDAVVRGTFDRLVLGKQKGKAVFAEVLDFKTDQVSVSDGEALRQRIEYYRPQMDAYRRAAAKFAGLKPKEVSAKLLFVTVGEVCEL